MRFHSSDIQPSRRPRDLDEVYAENYSVNPLLTRSAAHEAALAVLHDITQLDRCCEQLSNYFAFQQASGRTGLPTQLLGVWVSDEQLFSSSEPNQPIDTATAAQPVSTIGVSGIWSLFPLHGTALFGSCTTHESVLLALCHSKSDRSPYSGQLLPVFWRDSSRLSIASEMQRLRHQFGRATVGEPLLQVADSRRLLRLRAPVE